MQQLGVCGVPKSLAQHTAHFANQVLSCKMKLGAGFSAMYLMQMMLKRDGIIKSDDVDEPTRPG